jgi:xylulokinase
MTPNRSDPLLIGLDIGTTNIKAAIFDTRGQLVAGADAKTPTHYPRPGWAYFDPAEIWRNTCSALRQVTRMVDDPQRIVSIAVASIGETGFPIDAHGDCIYDAVAWYDSRAESQAEQIKAIIGQDRLYEITGLPPGFIYTLGKILWLKENEPDVYARIHTWLNTADYFAYRLSGVAATDYSLASRMLAMDIKARQWSTELIEAVGLNPDVFAPLRSSGTPLGAILPEMATDLGLPAHTLVSVGGHDHLCGAMAIGVTEPGNMLLSIGTAAGILVPTKQAMTDPAAGRKGFEMGAHVSPGYYGMPSYRTAGVCIEWFRDNFAKMSDGARADYATLIAEAQASPAGASGVRFLPHMRLPHSPYNDAKSRGAFLGLSTDVDRGDMFRAVLEGLAFETRSTVEPFLSDADIQQLHAIKAIGGGTRNRLLVEIIATVLNQRIDIVEVTEATALGAAILGGIGADVYPDMQSAQQQLVYSLTPVEPCLTQVALYDTIYSQVYSRIYEALRPLNHSNFELKYS